MVDHAREGRREIPQADNGPTSKTKGRQKGEEKGVGAWQF